jgi:hypothetical protein
LVKSKSYTSKQKGLTRIIMPLLVQEALHDEAMMSDLSSIERYYDQMVDQANSREALKKLYREILLNVHPDRIIIAFSGLVNEMHPEWTYNDYRQAGFVFNRLWEKIKEKKDQYVEEKEKEDDLSSLENVFTDERLAALHAVLGKARARDEKVIRAVAKLLRDHDETIRRTAADGLVHLEANLDQLVEVYTKGLESPFKDARRFAAETILKLAERGTTAAAPRDVANVIVESGDPTAAKKKLLERLKDYDNVELFERVLRRLGTTNEEMLGGYISALDSAHKDARLNAARKIGELSKVIDASSARGELLKRLADSYMEIIEAAENSLKGAGATNELLMKAYIAASDSAHRDTRLHAVQKIGELARVTDDVPAREALLKRLSDAYLEIIEAAEANLKIIGVTKEQRLKGYVLASDSAHRDTRLHAVQQIGALADVMDAGGREALLKRLADAYMEIIKEAEVSLKGVGVTNEQLMKAYVSASDSAHRDTRLHAVQKIGLLASVTSSMIAREPLLKRLSDAYVEIIEAAENSLKLVASSNEERMRAYILASDSAYKDTRLHAVKKMAELVDLDRSNSVLAQKPLLERLSDLYIEVIRAAEIGLRKARVTKAELMMGYENALRSSQQETKANAQKRLQELRAGSDEAFIAEPEKGGIDLNPNQNILQEHGEVVKPSFTDPAKWENYRTNGFVPVIINITPPRSLPLILGAIENASSGELSLSSLN